MNKLKTSSTHTITTNVGRIFNVSNVGMCQDSAAPSSLWDFLQFSNISFNFPWFSEVQ